MATNTKKKSRTTKKSLRPAQRGRRGTQKRAALSSQAQRSRTQSRRARVQERTGTDIFASTIQKTNLWLKDLAAELRTDDIHPAYLAMRAVLHTLRDRLPVGDAVHLGSQLPVILRGVYFEGWEPENKPIKYSKDEFIECIRGYFLMESGVEPREVIRSVFNVLERHTEGEVPQVFNLLPKNFQDIFVYSRTEGMEDFDEKEERSEALVE